MNALLDLRGRDQRYVVLSKKQIITAELAKRMYNNSQMDDQEAFLRYSDVEKIFNGKHNVERCIQKLIIYQIIKQISPDNPKVFLYIPIGEFKTLNQTSLLELIT